MKTRREFLAAAALGASATALAFPQPASAWGRRRRRCGCPYNECGCTSQLMLTGTGTGTTSCGCACPQYLYAQANGIYYYYCTCWSGGVNTGKYVIAPSSYYYTSLPVSPPNCIGDCNASKDGRFGTYTVHDECGFHLDPDATIPGGTTKHDVAFIEGITPQSFAMLEQDIRNPKYTPPNTVTTIGRVKYIDGSNTRHVALYEIKNLNADKCPLVHIGFEISDPPASTTPDPVDVGLPYLKGFPRYHHVYYQKFRFHVAIKKP
jgi:hypothetical protein